MARLTKPFLEEKQKAADETITKTVVNIHHSLATNLMCLKKRNPRLGKNRKEKQSVSFLKQSKTICLWK